MKVIADSHSFFWFVIDPEKLSPVALEALMEAEATEGIKVSVVTLFDLWYTTQKGGPSRIPEEQFSLIESVLNDSDANVQLLPLTGEAAHYVALASRNELPDPFDRMIAAAALENDLPLVTADKRIRDLETVNTIW